MSNPIFEPSKSQRGLPGPARRLNDADNQRLRDLDAEIEELRTRLSRSSNEITDPNWSDEVVHGNRRYVKESKKPVMSDVRSTSSLLESKEQERRSLKAALQQKKPPVQKSKAEKKKELENKRRAQETGIINMTNMDIV